ncbi:Gfo/Idh/MocA family oxidoreductase [Gulosibacter sp. 10]|uniref:Gfo/Idh/MocA family oxidoreductase n=1 Tax=Gulosibacter sp. 10 TaxID=1255570 RepID=UPI00097F65EC|nr:Gfo/Idh/MocA family oxidoreductase [Gulosibacter sp. 10]SJM55318.1 Myo-inositol 2-dehydrogenase [Gulosibacter sp. 10]
MRLGLVGYGTGGRYYHAPYIQAARGVELAGVVARSEARIAQIREELPGVPVYESLTALLDAGVDAVTITTPPETRRELALEAIGRGVHVIADKPVAPGAAAARELVAAAEDAGVLLSAFHNRRWDTDLATLKEVLAGGELGEIRRFDSAFNLDEPDTLEAGPTGGLLRDLGSHLVDQALHLFGPAESVTAYLDWVDLPEGRTDSGFFLNIVHRGGVHSHVSATKVNHLVSRELLALGSGGSYRSSQQDVQAQAVLAGRRPADDREGWGYEDPERWGVLSTAAGTRRVPSAKGDYTDYYERFAAAVERGEAQPVPLIEAADMLAVLDAARLSDAEGRTVRLSEQQ